MKTKGEDFAYPIFDNLGLCNDNETGLTKREYYAGLAMQGLLSANAVYDGKTNNRESLSKDAIAFADALIKELNK